MLAYMLGYLHVTVAGACVFDRFTADSKAESCKSGGRWQWHSSSLLGHVYWNVDTLVSGLRSVFKASYRTVSCTCFSLSALPGMLLDIYQPIRGSRLVSSVSS